VKKIESSYFIFCEKRKSVGKINKKYHVLKKRRKKKSGDSFRDIVRKKFVNDESYVSSSECYKSVEKFLPVVFEESVSEADMSNDS
jgi:hypothetical protein